MSKGRMLLVIVAAIVLVIAGVAVYILTNLDHIVKAAIEKYGSRAIRTEVRVGAVSIRLSSAEASIRQLSVANPRGFTAPNIFTLGSISAGVVPKSVTQSPIVIPDIQISSAEIFFERNSSGVSNIDVLRKNLEAEQTVQKEPGEKKPKGKEPRLFIKKLVFEKGRVEVRLAGVGGNPIVLDLPRLELTDIGKHGGATPTEIARTVATALAEQTAKAVARTQGENLLRKGAEGLLKKFQER